MHWLHLDHRLVVVRLFRTQRNRNRISWVHRTNWTSISYLWLIRRSQVGSTELSRTEDQLNSLDNAATNAGKGKPNGHPSPSQDKSDETDDEQPLAHPGNGHGKEQAKTSTNGNNTSEQTLNKKAALVATAAIAGDSSKEANASGSDQTGRRKNRLAEISSELCDSLLSSTDGWTNSESSLRSRARRDSPSENRWFRQCLLDSKWDSSSERLSRSIVSLSP